MNKIQTEDTCFILTTVNGGGCSGRWLIASVLESLAQTLMSMHKKQKNSVASEIIRKLSQTDANRLQSEAL